jgi:L-fuculose-phosphate aldolase
MSTLKVEVIKYSKKLNITNLSALRSGNISVRAKEKGIDGFYITPSGMKYSLLKIKDMLNNKEDAEKSYEKYHRLKGQMDSIMNKENP